MVKGYRKVLCSALSAMVLATVLALAAGVLALETSFAEDGEPQDPADISGYRVKISKETYVYAGKAIRPAVSVFDAEGNPLPAENYAVTYDNNDCVGKALIRVEGKDPYSGTCEKTFRIVPGKAGIRKIRVDDRRADVTIRRVKGDVRYEIQYKKSGGSWKTKKTGNLKATVRGLRNRKYYTFRVRGYKKVGGALYAGKWSSTARRQIGIPIKRCRVKGVKNKVYNGKNHKLKVKVFYKGRKIKCGVKFGNRKNIGRRWVRITGRGKFIGKVKKFYVIKPPRAKLKDFYAWAYYYDSFDDFLDDESKEHQGANYDKDFYWYICSETIAKKAKGNVKYQFAVKEGTYSWSYYNMGKGRRLSLVDFRLNKKLRAKVRAYKDVGGIRYYGRWSKVSTETSRRKGLSFKNMYRSDTRLKGTATNVRKGQKIRITVGKRKYYVKIKKNLNKKKFNVYVGKQPYGRRIKVELLSKTNEQITWERTTVWYSYGPHKGMTLNQCRYMAGWWSFPADEVHRYSNDKFYYWNYDGGYDYLWFHGGRLEDWKW